MGGDGGSIPTRVDMVKHKKQPPKVDMDALNSVLWHLCALSQDPLREPIVSCALGRLYNKEAVLQFMLTRDEQPPEKLEVMSHIRSLKDVVTLQLTPASEPGVIGACPVTNLLMNGKHKFVYLRTCGCVLSERCIREVPSETCLKCGKAFKESDMVALNPPADVQAKMKTELLMLRKLEKQKKSKKADVATGAGASGGSSKTEGDDVGSGAKRKIEQEKADTKRVAIAPSLAPEFSAALNERMDEIKKHSAMKSTFLSEKDKKKKDEPNFMSRTTFAQSFY